MEQHYPLLIHIFRNKNRYLICPYLDCVGGAHFCSPWFKSVNAENAEAELGGVITEAFGVIKESPLLNVRKTENEIGAFAFWKKENKSYSAFISGNFQIWLYLHEDGHFEICAPKRLDSNGYGGCLKACEYGSDTPENELAAAVTDMLDFEESVYGKKQTFILTRKQSFFAVKQ